MPKQTFLSRYSLIINRLEKGPATFEQIIKYLENESVLRDKDFVIDIRTFQRDIKDIYSQFNIEIANERKGEKRYFIISKPETENHSQCLLQGYQMINVINAAQDYAEHIFLETRRAKGLEHFYGLLHAIKNKKITKLNHYKYEDYFLMERSVHPLALKESRGRWYLIAVDIKDNILKSFGLDRIEDIDISKTSFRNKSGYNINELFKHSFGIINGESEKPQKVILSFTYEQAQYVKDYPLHHSQKMVKEINEEVIFELYLKLSYDFEMELLSYGEEVKVISPLILRKAMQRHYQNALKQY